MIWIEDADSRQNLGPSGIIQKNTAQFSLSDYPSGGYPVYAAAFGLSQIRSLIPCGYTGSAAGYVFQYEKPAVSGPASSNPGYLKIFEQNGTTGPLIEVSASNNINGATADFLAFGY